MSTLTDGLQELPWPGKRASYWDIPLKSSADLWDRQRRYIKRRRRFALSELYELAQTLHDPRAEKAVRALKDLGADEWLKVRYRA